MILAYQFVQHALLAALFAGLISGIMGTLITEKHQIMMTGGIAHASFAGISTNLQKPHHVKRKQSYRSVILSDSAIINQQYRNDEPAITRDRFLNQIPERSI